MLLTAVVGDDTNVDGTSKELGVSPTQVRKAKLARKHGVLKKAQRKVNKNKLSTEVLQKMSSFWMENTRVAAAQKHQVRRRTGPQTYTEHPIHWLSMTMAELYGLYVAELTPLCKKPSFSVFRKQRPWFVRRVVNNLTCVCLYCKKAYDMVNYIHVLRKRLHGKECVCTCTYCASYCGPVPATSPALPRTGNFFHFLDDVCCDATSVACTHGSCETCCDNFANVCPLELADRGVRYREYVTVTYEYKKKNKAKKT
jgi:hypothetical protein